MDDIKYLGVQGLEELIILAQNGLAKKADVLQFDVMPDPIKYIGKVVQYIGVSDVAFTRSHFYYSNGIKWTEENISGGQTTQIEMVTALPSWVNADSQILYILKDTVDKKMGLYVKNPSVNDSWFTVETSGSFAVVATLPQWADADSSTIYFKADGNILTGYIKKTGTIGAWYTLGGGAGSAIVIDTVLSATSTNPVQNKAIYAAIQDVLAQANMILTASQDADKKLQADIEANSNSLGMLGTEVSGIHDDIAANQTEIEANSNTLGMLGTEVSGIHDDIAANQTEIEAIKRNLLESNVNKRYVEDQNILSDLESIKIATGSSSPTVMPYDGVIYVSYKSTGNVSGGYFLNERRVLQFESASAASHSGTLTVKKGDTVRALFVSGSGNVISTAVFARFYKLRDYTGR